MSDLLSTYEAELLSLAAALLMLAIGRLTRLRARLYHSVYHASSLIVEEPLVDVQGQEIAKRQIVRAASITLRNAGLLPAKQVEVTFNWKPRIINILPARSYTGVDSPHDRYSIRFDAVAPGETISIEIMAINQELPALTSIRSEDCVPKEIAMHPMRVMPNWFNYSALALIVIGMATVIYLITAVLN